ncbi:Protoglobin-domain-containing protein [Trichophaea hybrida]|nr:Protoglobin-domain-containing protein [Trichophaea hybrida]
MSKTIIHHVSPSSLSDLPSRVEYLKQFIGFGSHDAVALQSAAPVLGPMVPQIVDAVYDKLLSFDITAQSFVPQQTGYTGETPKSVSDLSQEHPQIKFRKNFLSGYLVKLVTLDFEKMSSWEYLDKVGLMHTGQAGFAHRAKKPALRVEYIHCAILLGYVEDILINAVMTHPDLELSTKNEVARAANKLIWVQNDLFSRHYIAQAEAEAATKVIKIDRQLALPLALGLVATGVVLSRLSSLLL